MNSLWTTNKVPAYTLHHVLHKLFSFFFLPYRKEIVIDEMEKVLYQKINRKYEGHKIYSCKIPLLKKFILDIEKFFS